MPQSKKAQYYMFAAIIFIAAVFVISYSKSGISVKRNEMVNEIITNYVYEGTEVINNAMYHKNNVSEAMREYTENFIGYAESDIEKMGVVFMFSKEGKIYLNNYIDEEINIVGETNLAFGQERVMDFEDRIGIGYNNETYYYTFDSPEKTELKVLLVEKQ
jgi:hypothetical protein